MIRFQRIRRHCRRVDLRQARESFAEPAFWRDVLARLDDARG